jgi:hypothetical protein
MVPLSEEELRVQLDGFTDYFSSIIQNVAARIAGDTEDAETRRVSIVWKQRLVYSCRNSLLQPNPREALLDVWTLCVQLDRFHRSGRAREMFGKFAPLVIEASELSVERIEGIAELVIPDDALFAEAAEDVRDFAEEHPIRKGMARAVTLPSQVPDEEVAELSWVLSVPLAPFTAFSGLDKGAEAIYEMARVVDRVSRRAEGIPEQAIWELELLLVDALDSPRVRKTSEELGTFIDSSQEVASASTRLADLVASLPADVRAEVEKGIENVKVHHADFRETFASARDTTKEARAAIGDAQTLVKDVEGMSEPLERTSSHVADAGESWKGAVVAFHEMIADFEDEDAEPDPDARPFRIQDYEDTAEDMAAIGRELRLAIQELRGFVSEDLQGPGVTRAEKAAQNTVDYIRVSADALSNNAFWRGLALLAAAFLFGVAYTYVALRLKRRLAPNS